MAGGLANLEQAEFSLTQMLDRPVSGRIFFEQVIRDNIDIGLTAQTPVSRLDVLHTRPLPAPLAA